MKLLHFDFSQSCVTLAVAGALLLEDETIKARTLAFVAVLRRYSCWDYKKNYAVF